MVDRIELAMLDQRLVVGRLDHCHTILFEEPGDRCDKAIGVGNVSEHVVGMNDVRAYPLCMKRLGKVTREESAARGHANLLGGGGGAVGRIDAKHTDSRLNIVLQQIAVVAGQLDDEAIRTQTATRDKVKRVLARML